MITPFKIIEYGLTLHNKYINNNEIILASILIISLIIHRKHHSKAGEINNRLIDLNFIKLLALQ